MFVPIVLTAIIFHDSKEIHMNISRKLGILIFCGVPAIIGGGIVYHMFGTFIPVAIYETILLFVAGGLICK